MPPGERWILILAGLVSVAIALQAIVAYPLSTPEPWEILLYEMALFTGMLIILGLTYKKGYTSRDVPTV
jgi:hypothetical protein